MTGNGEGASLNRRRYLQLSTLAGASAAVGVGSGRVGAAGRPTVTNADVLERWDETITSHDGTELAATVFKPAEAATEAVPMIVQSHDWSGSRATSTDAFAAALERGFGVLSVDQRGHGDSGGESHLADPSLEGRDAMAVLDYVEGLDWVRRSLDDASEAIPTDPMVFGIGGGYGGVCQLVGAFAETAETGSTRFDALAPQATWFDLSESLAPAAVVRSLWTMLLSAADSPSLDDDLQTGLVWSAVTGQWPDGGVDGIPNLAEELRRHGPIGFVEDGTRLDVPVLFGQGIADELFSLNQGWRNFELGLTDAARERSALVGFDGGHELTDLLSSGEPFDFEVGPEQMPCGVDEFATLALDAFESIADGRGDPREVVGSPYALPSADGSRCLSLDALDDRQPLEAADALDVDVVPVDDAVDAGFPAVADLLEDPGVVEELESLLAGDAGGDLLDVIGDHAGPLERGLADVGGAPRLESLLAEVGRAGAGTPFDGLGGAFGFDPIGSFLDGRFLNGVPSVGSDFPIDVGDSLDADLLPVAPSGASDPTHLELAEGPLTLAGVPRLLTTVTSPGADNRLFGALSVGTSPADATVVGDDMAPLREPDAVRDVRRELELPGVSVVLDEAETLFLTLTGVSDAGGLESPGAMELEDLIVDLPVVGDLEDEVPPETPGWGDVPTDPIEETDPVEDLPLDPEELLDLDDLLGLDDVLGW